MENEWISDSRTERYKPADGNWPHRLSLSPSNFQPLLSFYEEFTAQWQNEYLKNGEVFTPDSQTLSSFL
jgi:hypothetical protein